jgi:hypothetical protein
LAQNYFGGKNYFWSTDTGGLLYQGEFPWTFPVVFSSDSTRIAGYLMEGKIGIWDVRSLIQMARGTASPGSANLPMHWVVGVHVWP